MLINNQFMKGLVKLSNQDLEMGQKTQHIEPLIEFIALNGRNHG